MELSELKDKICDSYSGSPQELIKILDMIDEDQSVFPFNEYEHLICNLLEIKGLTFDQYLVIRSDYISQNPNQGHAHPFERPQNSQPIPRPGSLSMCESKF